MASARSLTLDVRKDGVAILTFDVPGAAVNTLSSRFMPEWLELLDRLEGDKTIELLVVRSGKRDSFCAGADLDMVRELDTAEEAAKLSRTGQDAFDRFARLPFPTIAAVHGPALGGGCELALACKGRVASDDPKTVLGLPEVQLGLLPGLGGLKRLPRLIGIQDALDLALTGKNVRAAKAKKLGLVDDVAPAPVVFEAAIALGRRLAQPSKEPGRHVRTLEDVIEPVRRLVLEDNPAGRKLLFREAGKRAVAKTHGNYPAVPKILEVMEAHLAKGAAGANDVEARRFGELVVSEVSRQLVGIFAASQSLKKETWVSEGVQPREVGAVGILGAGLMGAGIATVAVQNGMRARIKDRDDAALGRGLATVRGILDERVARKALRAVERDRLLDSITTTTDVSGFGGVDLVIEAVFEDLELKRTVLREIEAEAEGDVVFASNTSSIPIGLIAEASRHPETVLGMHFFSPVAKMPLLEIIVSPKTSERSLATAVTVGKRMGKTVIVVNDGVGFYTSRILGPYMNETAWALADGNAIEAIDRALIHWGFPVGPVALLDEVGIDVAAKVGKIVHEAFGDRMSPPPLMERLVEDGRSGRKNEKGFYSYGAHKKGEGKKVDTSVYAVLGIEPRKTAEGEHAMAERIALTMVNEAIRCLGEGVLRSPRDGDVGAIFGLGFPPFRGGPFRWVDAEGPAVVLGKLEALMSRHGSRFDPAPLLVDMVRRGTKGFY